MDIDYAIRKDEPCIIETSTLQLKLPFMNYRSDLIASVLCSLRPKSQLGICGSVDQYDNIKALLKAIDEQFETSYKVLTSTLIMKFSSLRFTSVRGVHEHIM